MFSRILVGLDGSEHGAWALAVATELAVAERGRLTLMAVVPRPSPWAWAGPFIPDELPRDAERYYEAVLRTAAEGVPQQVPAILLLRHGRAADRLLDEVRRDHYDLIVVGSRERGRMHSALFGGLGQKLERQSPIPVLAVPAPTTDVHGSERGRGPELRLVPVEGLHRHGSSAA